MNTTPQKQPGFTIVELLIVIVVIGILAAITVVAYNGVQNRAYVVSAQNDLTNIGKQIQMEYINNGSFPTTDAIIKKVMQNAQVWNATRADASKNYLFCANDTKYSVISLRSPGMQPYEAVNSTVYYWSNDRGVQTYVNAAGEVNLTPNCDQTVGTTSWRRTAAAIN